MTPKDIFETVEPIPGWLSAEDVEEFSRLDMPDRPQVLECGTYCGKSATVFSLLWPGASITTCDPVDEPARTLPEEIRFYNCKGTDVPEASSGLDLLFIDDSHLLPDIRENFERYWPAVKEGGYCVFHDYLFETAPAVRELVDTLPFEKELTGGPYGLAIIRKRKS